MDNETRSRVQTANSSIQNMTVQLIQSGLEDSGNKAGKA